MNQRFIKNNDQSYKYSEIVAIHLNIQICIIMTQTDICVYFVEQS